MEEIQTNQNSLIPVAKGNLLRANGSIALTSKILSESVHEFHGDFEGKKIWEVQTGINFNFNVEKEVKNKKVKGFDFSSLLAGMTFFHGKIFIYKDILVVYDSSVGFKCFNKKTGELVQINSEFLGSRCLDIFNDNEDILFVFRREGDCIFLSKLFLPELKNTFFHKEITPDKILGNWKREFQITPDNKYVITTSLKTVLEPRISTMYVVFLDIVTLDKIQEFSIENAKQIIFIKDSNKFLVLKDKVRCPYDGDWIDIDAMSLWLFDYSDFKSPCFNELFNFSYNYNDNSDLLNNPHYVEAIGVGKCYYNSISKLLFLCNIGERLIYDIETKKLIKELDSNDLLFSNTGNYLLQNLERGISLFDTKKFKLISQYDWFYPLNGIKAIKSIFDSDDKYIYTLFDNGSIHKWK